MKQRVRRKIKRRSITFLRMLAVIVFAAGAFASLVYIFFFSGIFYIHDVVVSSPKSISETEVKAIVDGWLNSSSFGISRRNNSLMLDEEDLEDALRSNFQKLKSVSVEKISRNSIKVVIEDRKPAGIWCTMMTTKCFYFDVDGVAYLEIPQSTGFLFPGIQDFRDRNIVLGEAVESAEWIQGILFTQNSLKFAGLGVMDYKIASDSYDEFTVDTTEGWEIKLNSSINVKQQMSSLIQFLETTISPEERSNLQYVDLRIKDRIYYK